MKLEHAEFVFKDKTLGIVSVWFLDDLVVVLHGDPRQRSTIDNKLQKWGGRTYKPCVTHAQDAVRVAIAGPPKTEQERQRAEKVKPGLRLHGEA